MYGSKTRKEKFSGPGKNCQSSVTCKVNRLTFVPYADGTNSMTSCRTVKKQKKPKNENNAAM